MGVEQKASFTPVTERQYNLLKGLHNAARTMAVDNTMDRVVVGFEEGVKRELTLEGLGEVAEDVAYHSRDGGWQVLDRNGEKYG